MLLPGLGAHCNGCGTACGPTGKGANRGRVLALRPWAAWLWRGCWPPAAGLGEVRHLPLCLPHAPPAGRRRPGRRVRWCCPHTPPAWRRRSYIWLSVACPPRAGGRLGLRGAPVAWLTFAGRLLLPVAFPELSVRARPPCGAPGREEPSLLLVLPLPACLNPYRSICSSAPTPGRTCGASGPAL